MNESTRSANPSRFAYQKLSDEQTAARAKEAASRLSGEIKEYISQEYWTQASNSLRRAMGTLRFDVNNITAARGDKESAKDLFNSIEALDFALRSKDLDAATAAVAEASAKADVILK